MIRLITGVPRSGKSYLAVHEILEKLAMTDKNGQLLNILLITNIEGMKIDDARLLCFEFDKTFFQNTKMAPYLREMRDKHGLNDEDIIYLYIDEAQRYFAKPDSDTEFFFDYHGHYGVEVTLITQHIKKLSFNITCHHEEEYRSAAQSTNPLNSFVYKKLQAGEQFGTLRLNKEKRVFDSYKSFHAGSGTPKKSRFRYYVLALVIGGILMWFIFFKVFASSFGLGDEKEQIPRDQVMKNSMLSERAPVPPSPGQNPPLPAKPSPGQNMEDEKPESLYVGPLPLEYSSGRDAVRLQVGDQGLDAWVSVSDFIREYPPQIYGYGYFHGPNRMFVLMSAANNKILFPVENPLFVRASFIENSAAVEPIEPEVPYGTEFSGPGLTDKNGFTENDRVFMRYAELLSKGYHVKKPASPGQSSQEQQPNQEVIGIEDVKKLLKP